MDHSPHVPQKTWDKIVEHGTKLEQDFWDTFLEEGKGRKFSGLGRINSFFPDITLRVRISSDQLLPHCRKSGLFTYIPKEATGIYIHVSSQKSGWEMLTPYIFLGEARKMSDGVKPIF